MNGCREIERSTVLHLPHQVCFSPLLSVEGCTSSSQYPQTNSLCYCLIKKSWLFHRSYSLKWSAAMWQFNSNNSHTVCAERKITFLRVMMLCIFYCQYIPWKAQNQQWLDPTNKYCLYSHSLILFLFADVFSFENYFKHMSVALGNVFFD